MSGCTEVERPLLHRLQALGRQVTDQGPDIPADPAKSLRQGFRHWILPEVFAQSVSAINTTADGGPWLTPRQLQDLRDQTRASRTGPC
jgi:type I restriction enzyme R subunit